MNGDNTQLQHGILSRSRSGIAVHCAFFHIIRKCSLFLLT
jgi:hypothetical protein